MPFNSHFLSDWVPGREAETQVSKSQYFLQTQSLGKRQTCAAQQWRGSLRRMPLKVYTERYREEAYWQIREMEDKASKETQHLTWVLTDEKDYREKGEERASHLGTHK